MAKVCSEVIRPIARAWVLDAQLRTGGRSRRDVRPRSCFVVRSLSAHLWASSWMTKSPLQSDPGAPPLESLKRRPEEAPKTSNASHAAAATVFRRLCVLPCGGAWRRRIWGRSKACGRRAERPPHLEHTRARVSKQRARRRRAADRGGPRSSLASPQTFPCTPERVRPLSPTPASALGYPRWRGRRRLLGMRTEGTSCVMCGGSRRPDESLSIRPLHRSKQSGARGAFTTAKCQLDMSSLV